MVVSINHSKCLGAKDCGKCMKSCPLGVFMNVPTDKFIFGREPTARKIIPYYTELCNSCGICIENCPVKCITL